FSLLSLIDVRASHEPSNNSISVIMKRLVPHGKPSILAVVSLLPRFDLKRNALQKPFLNGVPQASHIVRVSHALAKVLRLNETFRRESKILAICAVDAENRPIRP